MTKIPSPWKWIPSLYFAEGLPYVAVMTIAVIMYNRLGLSNPEIALYTSWLYLPWVIKPLWSPLVDILRTKRWWIVAMQLLIGISFAGIAFTISTDFWIQGSLAFFWLMAFSSATNDIASDGFYMIGLDQHQQAWCIGVRNTFYRTAMITGQGVFVILAGWLEKKYEIQHAWRYTFVILSCLYISLALYHQLALPKISEQLPLRNNIIKEFSYTFSSFFRKTGILRTLAFLLTFRFAEAQLAKLTTPFLLDSPQEGGLGLSTESVGFAYGTVGMVALITGGILGGIAISAKGLKYWLWPMALAITMPNAVYLVLSSFQLSGLWMVNAAIFIEQLGYGFGFTAYTLYIIYAVRGNHKTAHYAIATAFMALGMMIPGMISGQIQEWLGYNGFFIWVMCCTIPVLWGVSLIKVDPLFGTKSYSESENMASGSESQPQMQPGTITVSQNDRVPDKEI